MAATLFKTLGIGLEAQGGGLQMKKTYKHYSVLTSDDMDMIRESLIAEHKTPNHVSRSWLIERLSQCVCWIDLIEGRKACGVK